MIVVSRFKHRNPGRTKRYALFGFCRQHFVQNVIPYSNRVP